MANGELLFVSLPHLTGYAQSPFGNLPAGLRLSMVDRDFEPSP